MYLWLDRGLVLSSLHVRTVVDVQALIEPSSASTPVNTSPVVYVKADMSESYWSEGEGVLISPHDELWAPHELAIEEVPVHLRGGCVFKSDKSGHFFIAK